MAESAFVYYYVAFSTADDIRELLKLTQREKTFRFQSKITVLFMLLQIPNECSILPMCFRHTIIVFLDMEVIFGLLTIHMTKMSWMFVMMSVAMEMV